eukprot:COSAG06_NODE_4903_length_3871_cov_35.018293_2_plen_153_part_00
MGRFQLHRQKGAKNAKGVVKARKLSRVVKRPNGQRYEKPLDEKYLKAQRYGWDIVDEYVAWGENGEATSSRAIAADLTTKGNAFHGFHWAAIKMQRSKSEGPKHSPRCFSISALSSSFSAVASRLAASTGSFLLFALVFPLPPASHQQAAAK